MTEEHRITIVFAENTGPHTRCAVSEMMQAQTDTARFRGELCTEYMISDQDKAERVVQKLRATIGRPCVRDLAEEEISVLHDEIEMTELMRREIGEKAPAPVEIPTTYLAIEGL